MEFCAKWYDKPVNSIHEMKQRENKKIRGDIFEEFCVLYLKHVKKYDEVYLLKDVDDELLNKLSLRRQDMGVDIVVKNGNEYYAVQCKYRKYEIKSTCVTWKQLSTFYGLCLRTGPWNKYIVMTTANYVKREGRKTENDLSICFGTFNNLTSEDWLKMCQITGNILSENNKEKISLEDLREKRKLFYKNSIY